jgi:hypothetical protein
MKLQHNYKIENKITLNSFFTHSFFLPTNLPMETCTNPKEIQGREWLHLVEVEWGGGFGLDVEEGRLFGEDGGRLQRVRQGEGVGCKGGSGRGG